MTDLPQAEGTEPIETNEHTLVLPPRTDETGPVDYDGNRIKDKVLAGLVSVALTGLVVTSAITGWSHHTNRTVEVPTTVVAVAEAPRLPQGKYPYQNMNISARAAIVYDVHADAVLYEQRADDVRPLASLTKLMTGLLASEALDDNAQVLVTNHAIQTEGDSGLLANETWRAKDLVSFMLMTSSNDGADAVAAAVGSLWDLEPSSTPEYEHVDTFVGKMNDRASELGLDNTFYRNPSGLDESAAYSGGQGSARDMAKLLRHVWEHSPETLEQTTVLTDTFVSEDGFIHDGTNTNPYVNALPGYLGGKTGYTEFAGGNLAVVYDAGLDHPVVIVVLGSTIDGRFEDVQTLLGATSVYMQSGWYQHEVAGTTPSR